MSDLWKRWGTIGYCSHAMAHFRIVTCELFDDKTGGPASSSIKTIERKCTKCGLIADPEVIVTGIMNTERR